MSYLHTPRIVFSGTYRSTAPTKNNVRAALTDPVIMKSGDVKGAWDFSPEGRGNFGLMDCKVSCAWNPAGRFLDRPGDDPVIGAPVIGTGKMADLDPEQRRVTDLIGMNLVLTLATPVANPKTPGTSVSGVLETCQFRDYWSDPNTSVATSWQSVLSRLLWTGDYTASPILAELQRISPQGLSVRISPVCPTFCEGGITGPVFGVIGPYEAGEPRQFVAARRLIRRPVQGPCTYPVASTLVDEARRTLVVDLSNLPLATGQEGTMERINSLVATILRDPAAGGGIEDVVAPRRNINTEQWLATGGIVEWPLTDAQVQLLRTRRLQLTCELANLQQSEGQAGATKDHLPPPPPPRSTLANTDAPQYDKRMLILEEHPSGKYADVDRHSIRLNPGASETFDVYARRFGRPLAGEVLTFGLYQQLAIAPLQPIIPCGNPGYPANPNLLINSEPRDVIVGADGPLQVTTDRDGFAHLRVQIRPGSIDLPQPRQALDSQLYFLGDPNGWQTWGAFGANSDDLIPDHRVGMGCLLSVLVFNTHTRTGKPTWDEVRPLLERYANLYPVMKGPAMRLDLNEQIHITRYAAELVNRLNLPFDDVAHMPVTRDLSDYHLQMILGFLREILLESPPVEAQK